MSVGLAAGDVSRCVACSGYSRSRSRRSGASAALQSRVGGLNGQESGALLTCSCGASLRGGLGASYAVLVLASCSRALSTRSGVRQR